MPSAGAAAVEVGPSDHHAGDPGHARTGVAHWAGLLTVGLAAAWWVLVATRWFGGRDAGAVTGGAILTAAAVALVRPHQVLPSSVVWLATWLSFDALLVAAVAPSGWAGASNAADYVVSGWALVAVAAAVVRDRRMTQIVLGLLAIGAMVEVSEGWLAWWGGESAAAAMTGTFYWWNPYAAYLLPGGLIGLALWAHERRVLAMVGLLAFAMSSIGIVYSTSRASFACLAVGVILIVGAAAAQGRRTMGRSLIGVVGGAACVWLVAGPPFFPHRTEPFASTVARNSSQSLGQNGSFRVQFWREAIGVFGRHPVTGGGYHSLASASFGHNPSDWAYSPLAHSGYVQPLSDGGLLLSVPFLLGCLAVASLVLFGVVRAMKRRDFSPAAFVVPVALGAAMAHSAIDFDWSYPANFLLTATLAGLVVGHHFAGRPRRVGGGYFAVCAVLVGVVTLGIAAEAAWSGDLRQNLPVSHSAASR